MPEIQHERSTNRDQYVVVYQTEFVALYIRGDHGRDQSPKGDSNYSEPAGVVTASINTFSSILFVRLWLLENWRDTEVVLSLGGAGNTLVHRFLGEV